MIEPLTRMLTIEGATVFVDLSAVTVVAPAVAPPQPGVPAHMAIPKVIGSQIVMPGMNLGLKEMPEDVAAAVNKAKSRRLLTN